MRLLGTLPAESDARRLADFLLTLGISTRVNVEASSWEIWVRDDDHLPRAREEWMVFKTDPNDARFVEAERAATALKQQQEAAEKLFRRNQRQASELWETPRPSKAPLTIGLLAFCVLVAILTSFARVESPATQALTFTSFEISARDDDFIVPLIKFVPEGYDPWIEGLRHGELWRLWSPIVLHMSFWHLVLNMLALLQLGIMIEARRGSLWLFGFILVTGLLSNLAQYFLAPWFTEHLLQGEGKPSLLFGGMSGVLFALFGYLWMKVQFDPEPGLYMDRQTVILMLCWLALCMTGYIGSIANTAHVTGLLSGMVVGIWRTALKRWRRSDP